MNYSGKHKLMFLAITGLVVLLPFLATLQYRWLGQLSSSEVTRLRASLQTSARHFGRSIDHEIYPVQWAFRVSFTQSLDEIARQLRTGYSIWSVRTNQPELIESIYWVDYDNDRRLNLFRFDPHSGELSQIPWPSDLEGWRTYFIERTRYQLEFYQPLYAQADLSSPTKDDFLALGAHLMVERPAVIIPVSIDSDIASENLLANLNATTSGIAGHTLITLNRTHLVESFFPTLCDSLVYSIEPNVDLMIVSSVDSNETIFQSDDQLDISRFEKPDARQNIARFRWMPFTSASRIALGYTTLIERDQDLADSLVTHFQQLWSPEEEESYQNNGLLYQTDYPAQAIIQLAQEENYKGELTAEHLLMALSRVQSQAELVEREQNRHDTQRSNAVNTAQQKAPPTKEQIAPDTRAQQSLATVSPETTSSALPTKANVLPAPVAATALPSPPLHAWTLLLRHKEGSLETAVQANQRRNLFLSFGILSILGVAILLIYNSAQRARTLAERQMDFIAGVSHELRTPLAVILSASENIADGVVSDKSRLKQYGELIGKEGKRLSDMVEHVLELAGIQSGKNTYTKERVNVEDLIQESISAWQKQLDEKHFEVHVEIEDNLPDFSGDPRALHMTLSNLISNAIKYSTNGCQYIGITASKCPDSNRLVVEVTDKGAGIPQEELPHLFDQFYRGKAAMQAQIQGNGIGLSIVKKTMDGHRGIVSVKSKLNKGSTFTLYFPL